MQNAGTIRAQTGRASGGSGAEQVGDGIGADPGWWSWRATGTRAWVLILLQLHDYILVHVCNVVWLNRFCFCWFDQFQINVPENASLLSFNYLYVRHWLFIHQWGTLCILIGIFVLLINCDFCFVLFSFKCVCVPIFCVYLDAECFQLKEMPLSISSCRIEPSLVLLRGGRSHFQVTLQNMYTLFSILTYNSARSRRGGLGERRSRSLTKWLRFEMLKEGDREHINPRFVCAFVVTCTANFIIKRTHSFVMTQ